MTRWFLTAALAITLVFTGLAQAKGAKGARVGKNAAGNPNNPNNPNKSNNSKDDALTGKLVSVNISTKDKTASIEILTPAGADKTISVDPNISVTVDGKSAKLADLQAGEMVKITPSTGTPAVIAATTGKADAGNDTTKKAKKNN
jgi:hypothetical protein